MHMDYFVVVGAQPARRAHPFRDLDAAYTGLAGADTAPMASISLLRDFETVGPAVPSVEEVFDRFVQRFTHRHAAKSLTIAPIHLELEISPQQAARGGALSIAVPVLYPCAECGGTGMDSLYHCTGCGGRGVLAAEEAMRFEVPPRLGDGDILEVALSPEQVLRLEFRVGA